MAYRSESVKRELRGPSRTHLMPFRTEDIGSLLHPEKLLEIDFGGYSV